MHIDELRRQLKEKDRLISTFQKRVQELEAQVDKLQTQVEELNCRMKSYECDQDRLYLCQVAVEFERALCSHVIPEVFSRNYKRTSSANLDHLLNMLNSGDQGLIPLNLPKDDIKTILHRARQRWEKCVTIFSYLQSGKQSLGRKSCKRSTSLIDQSLPFSELWLY